MGKKKIVIDTNNYISALGWKGKPWDLFRKVINKEFELYLSLNQLDEIKRVMDYPKFQFTGEQISKFLEILSEVATIIDTKISLNAVRDPDDNTLIECAVGAKADYVISGDKDLLDLREYKNIKIVTVSEFLERESLPDSKKVKT